MNEEVIFQEAARITDPQARQSFLEMACAGEPELLQRLLARLAELKTQGPAGTQPPAPPHKRGDGDELRFQVSQPGAVEELAVGTIIAGQYKVLEKLGQGGMGEVYVVDQFKPFHKRLALKIVRPGFDASQNILNRFEQERQALALMDHPNIAKIFDAGSTESGRPFFVMELVKGLPLTRFCDQEKLSLRERLELFVPICQAVQHAHQKGIIHRDLKPSNILVTLVDGAPVPKIIDFGVAKAVHQTLSENTVYTDIGSIVGTYEYMSPEQAKLNNLDIDTRTDIYSLGIILYELLTGSLPFSREELRAAGLDEIIRVIREVEPQKPSTKLSHSDELPRIAALRKLEPRSLTRLVSGDLDWIVLKCLEKERNRRYETANGLGLDLQRYLRDEPVLAGPPSAVYRLRKFYRKHRGKVLAAAALLLLLVAGVISTTVEVFRAQRAERAAETEAAISKAVNDFLLNDLLGLADVERQIAGGLEPDSEIKLKTLLGRASALLGSGKLSGLPLVQASLHHTMGNAFLAVGDFKLARSHLQQAEQLRRRLLGDNHPLSLETRVQLGRVLVNDSKHKEAEPILRALVQDMNSGNGVPPVQLLEARRLLACALEGDSRYEQADAIYASLEEEAAGKPELLRLLISVLQSRAWMYYLKKDYPAAETVYQRLLELHARTDPRSPEVLITKNNLAILCSKKGEHSRAESLYREILKAAAPLYEPDHILILRSKGNLAKCLYDQKRMDEAGALMVEVVPQFTRKYGPDHQDAMGLKNNLAAWYLSKQDFTHAEALLLELAASAERIYGEKHDITLRFKNSLAGLYERIDKQPEARKYFQQVLEGRLAQPQPDRTLLFHNHVNAGHICLKLKDYPAAERYLAAALEKGDSSKVDPWQVGRYYRIRGDVCRALNQEQQAGEMYKKSRNIFELDYAQHQDKYSAGSERLKEFEKVKSLVVETSKD